MLHHMRNSVLTAEEGAFEVDIHDFVPRGLGNVGHTAVLGWHDAGVVVENIHPPERIDGGGDYVLALVLIGDIGCDKDSFATCLTNVPGRLLTLFGHNISNDNACPLLGKEFCGHLAHAAGSSGDD